MNDSKHTQHAISPTISATESLTESPTDSRSISPTGSASLPATMKAVVATGYGGPQVLEIAEVPRPEPKADELLVAVQAASATQADAMMRTGKPMFVQLFVGIKKPKKPIPGTGFSGKVVAVGEQVTAFEVGDRVFGETAWDFSANAEYLVIKQDGVVLKLPETIDAKEAASFCDGHLTSYNFLTEVCPVKPGQRVLINGASGALGTAAVQIAKHLGAHTTGVASTRNMGLLKELGVDDAIDYTVEDYTERRGAYDVVFDTVGKSSFHKSKAALKPGGRYLTPVFRMNMLPALLGSMVSGNKKAVFEATGTNKLDKLRRMLGEVLELVQHGAIKTVIDRRFPLEKVSEAHRYIDAGRKRGNVVLVTA